MNDRHFSLPIAFIAIGALAWAIVPIAVMLLFWFRWYYSVPAAGLLVYGFCLVAPRILKAKSFEGVVRFDLRIIFVMLLIIGWMVLIGVGGFLGQEGWDNSFRNAVLAEMIDRQWPVICTDYKPFAYLSYYFCYWMVPAAVGKLFHSYVAGQVGLFIWTFLGLASVVLMMMHYCKRRYLLIAFLTLAFATPDILNLLIYNVGLHWVDDVYVGTRILSAPTAPYLTTFIYNQGVPLMVIMMLMFQARDISYQLFLLASLFCYAPFMSLTLIPIVGVKMLMNIKESATWPNAAGMVVALLCSVFYLGNSDGTKIEPLTNIYPSWQIAWLTLGWIVFNLAIFLPFIWGSVKDDIVFWSLVILTIFFGMWVPGHGNLDFGWKTPAPLFFYLMLKLFPVIAQMKWDSGSRKGWALGIVLAIGLASNFSIAARIATRIQSFTEVYLLDMPNTHPYRLHRSDSLEGHLFDPAQNACYNSFVTDRETLFSKYFMRLPDHS